jgi:hypothetical protein
MERGCGVKAEPRGYGAGFRERRVLWKRGGLKLGLAATERLAVFSGFQSSYSACFEPLLACEERAGSHKVALRSENENNKDAKARRWNCHKKAQKPQKQSLARETYFGYELVMRRRIIIGCLVIGGLGSLAGALGFALSGLLGPKKGSIEWHKREYLASLDRLDRLYERRFVDRVKSIGRDESLGSGVHPKTAAWKAAVSEVDEHRNALVRLGYLEARDFRLTNGVAESVVKRGWWLASREIPKRRMEFTRLYVRDGTSNVVVIVGHAEDMPRLEGLVGELDVREPKSEP